MNHIGGKASSSSEGEKRMQEMNSSQPRIHPMKVEAKDQVVNNFSFPMNREIVKVVQSSGSHGSDHVSKSGKLIPISFPNNTVNQPEPVFCVTKRKEKAAYEDTEMDPEIQHLIEVLFWEIDNCPPSLTGRITLHVNKTVKARLPPKKPQRVYRLEDLFQ